MTKIKTLYIICAAVVGFGFASCRDMDLEPKDVLGEQILFRNDYGIQKYLARVYNELPIEDFNYDLNGDHPGYGYAAGGYHNGNDYWGCFKGYSGGSALEVTCRGTGNDPGGGFGYWPYGRIRDINNLIEALPNYEKDLTAKVCEEALGEAHFLRAFYYFGMVKRFGGVPIVDEVQNPRDSLAALRLPRNTEYDCWKFIHDDLEYAMEHASADKSNTTRGNRYSAAALMARAMLYAGSVAKYGGYTGVTGPAVTAGLQGMSSDHAKEFFQYAYDACKFLHDAGFTLHTGSDKETAYVETFTQENKDEDIFVKEYGTKESRDSYDKSALLHGWDDSTLPLGTNMAANIGCGIQPVYELLSLYEMPAITDADGKPVRFNSLNDLWNSDQMEARCRANFYFSGMTETASGQVINCQAGVYTSFPGTTADACTDNGKQSSDYNNKYLHFAENRNQTTMEYQGKTIPLRGEYGYYTGLGDEGTTYTGVYIRKYVNPKAAAGTRGLFGSSTPFKVFRYGQVLMDWAEAAYELGLETDNESLKQEAFTHVNEIRDRAGAHRHEMVANPADVGSEVYGFPIDENLQYIRDERRRELCFENLTYWDFRRWRVSDAMFQNYLPHIFNAYYVADEGKYIFLPQYEEHLGRHMTFPKRDYYEQIPGGEINKNPNLVRNDGY